MNISRLLCAALAVLVVSASVSEARHTLSEIRAKTALKNVDDPGVASSMKSNKGATDRVLGLDATIFDSLENGFSYYNNTQSPLRYDPNTGLLVTVLRGGIPGDPVFNRNRGFLRYSEDLGETWSDSYGPMQDPIDPVQDSLRYPNVAIYSPEGATGVADLTFIHSYPYVNGGWGQYGIGFTFGNELQPFSFPVPPLEIEGEEYDWLPNTCLTIAPDGETGIVFVPLDAPEFAHPENNNNIGMIKYNWAEDDEPVGSVPEPFQSLVFDEPVDIGTTAAEDLRTNRLIQTGWDGNGALYVGVIGELRANGSAAWDVPMIIKSTDFGDTWSEWDFLPEQDFVDYLNSIGAIFPTNSDYFLLGQDMQVVGEDHVVIVCSLVEGVESDNELDRILEFEYNSGQWTIRYIGPNTGRFQSFFHSQEEFDTNDGQQPQTLPDVQVSITADGQTLVAKWVDLVAYTVLIDGEETEITSYDIFFSTRAVGSGEWSPAVNVTNSIFHEKVTWIPDIIPSLTEVPLITNRTNFAVNTWLNEQEAPDDSLNLNIAQRMIFADQHVMYTKLDLTGTSTGVGEGGQSLPKAANITVAPNPATNVAHVNFELPNTGHTTVSVFDLFGRKIATIHDGLMPAGTHSLEYNVNGSYSGTYFVQVTLDGVNTSESFMITR